MVKSWEATDDGVTVHTTDAEITARRLVIATGAWSAPGLGRLGIDAHVWRKVLFWHDTPEPEPFLADNFPTFYVEKDYKVIAEHKWEWMDHDELQRRGKE